MIYYTTKFSLVTRPDVTASTVVVAKTTILIFLAMMDLIFIILVAEASTHALGDYASVSEAMVVVLTMMTWNYLINVLSYHFPKFNKVVSAPPLKIIAQGKLNRRNMRREYLTEDEQMEQLRKEGVESVSQVKYAFVEGDGTITVVPLKK